ncbi:MAG: bifunctional DNA-formamidopyrimidine glycosylase/DNA-(apurinic or apyrimidinic site) lyase [Anaerolineae bacterium]|nr:bifunctional DNA-formamidopyrimidine glycosylase/DNA-(apurinic or apyrimidinic site) lyase [Anaerolineae bacterium]
MPELPEVETIAADLRPQLVGARFVAGHILWPRTLAEPSPDRLNEQLAGRRVCAIGRRGKYLLIHLDPPAALIFHLRMTGRLDVVAAGAGLLAGPHLRAWFALDDGRRLAFTDARKFGRIWLVEDAERVVGALGPEPLDRFFTADVLKERLAGRRAAIKAVLLDQRVVAGVGNIYADEALFVAGLHPLRPAADLTATEVGRLCEALQFVLRESIAARGTLLRDYRTPYGQDGAYQNRLRVYRQAGQPCSRCGTPIERIRVTQRSTHFCPRCQPQ